MELHVLCVGQGLYVVVPIDLMLRDKVAQARAKWAIVALFLQIIFQVIGRHGHFLDPHRHSERREELVQQLESIGSQAEVGKVIGYALTV